MRIYTVNFRNLVKVGWVLLAAFPYVGVASERALLPIGDLNRFRTSLVDHYPPTVCALRALAGKEYEEMLQRAHTDGLSGMTAEWEKAPVEAGSVMHINRHWQNPGGFVLWVHESGALVLGIRKADALELFTTAKQIADNPPAPIRAWIEEGKSARLSVHWSKPSLEGIQFPPSCTPEKLATDLSKFRAAEDGTSCSIDNIGNLSFTETPYLIVPTTGDGRTPILPALAAPSSDKNPYLVAGDMVQLATTNFKIRPIDGKVCAYYRSSKGRETVGWISEDSAKMLPEDESADVIDRSLKAIPATSWFLTSKYRSNFPGKYKRDQAVIKDTLSVTRKAGMIYAKLKGDPDVFDTESFGASLVHPRLARYEETSNGKPALTASLRLFNNGIFVHLENHQARTNYWAIYYP